MRLHLNSELFEQSVQAASSHFGIRAEFIEKDYWITLILFRLANSPFRENVVFKGGTSLSKGFGLLDRFSEDVDLAVIEDPSRSGNELKELIRTVEKFLGQDLIEDIRWIGAKKFSRYRKSAYLYATSGDFNGGKRVIIELNAFANPVPFQESVIESLIAKFFKQANFAQFVDEGDLGPFKILVMSLEQTLVEKFSALVRASFASDAVLALSEKIRHFYDLYFVLEVPEVLNFVTSGGFVREFIKVYAHDQLIFEEPLGWNDLAWSESVLFQNFDAVWARLRFRYESELSGLAFSEIPSSEMVAARFGLLLKSFG